MPTTAGKFLVARAALSDPNFTQTVVLILQHDGTGAFGLVVNRPVEDEELPFRLYAGGPCTAKGLVLLHGHPDWLGEDDDPAREVAPGVFIGDASCMERIRDGGELRYRIFTGYAGWGADQLERELTAQAWHIVPATAELLFDAPSESLWDHLMPPLTPQPSLN